MLNFFRKSAEFHIKIVKIIENVFAGYFSIAIVIYLFMPLIVAISCFGCNGEQIDRLTLTKLMKWLFSMGTYAIILTKALLLMIPVVLVFLIIIYYVHKKRGEIGEYRKFFIKRFVIYTVLTLISFNIYQMLLMIK